MNIMKKSSKLHLKGKSMGLPSKHKATRFTSEWRLRRGVTLFFEGTAAECLTWLEENGPIEDLRIEQKEVFEGWSWEQKLMVDFKREARQRI